MEDTDSFPPEILRTPQPLVAFLGLDLGKSTHRRVWDVFTSNRGLDRHSLLFKNVSDIDSLDLPPAKQQKNGYEWYVPKGILKKNWINKHQNVIPSVIVSLLELNWSDPELAEKAKRCGERMRSLRSALAGRSTKLALVLLQDANSVGDTDAVTGFCTECEISPRSLFVIGLKDQLLSAAVRLEAALHELSQNYYHLEIKRVRSHKDALNKSSHMLLMIRHMFKIGYLNEMKSDLHSAQKAYQTAYSLILEVKMNDYNVPEFRTVAGYVNYKICRLDFKLNMARDAIAQFRKHLDNFKGKSGMPELGWEHAAWQCQQSAMFANLFLEVHRNGQIAIQTQHPGIYYQLASDYAVSRRKLAEEQCSQLQSYPDPDPLCNQVEFYGQRPWRPGKMEPVDLPREKEGIEALQYRERTKAKHSQIIIKLQQAAVDQFSVFNSPRMKNQVYIQMADELMIDQQYKEALAVLLSCSQSYRKEGWLKLTTSTLLKAIKCAFLTIDVELYVSLCLDLLGPGASCSATEKERIEQNLFLLVDMKAPLPEPCLTGKNERALVGQAAKLWLDKLNAMTSTRINVPDLAVIDFIPEMPSSWKVGDSVSLTLQVVNSTQRVLQLLDIQCKFNLEQYDRLCIRNNEIVLNGNSKTKIQFDVKPESEDLDKELKLSSVQFRMKCTDKIIYEKRFEKVAGSSTKLVARESNIEVKLGGTPPVLVGEWFNLNLNLLSNGTSASSNIEVICWLRDGVDPLISDTTELNTFPGFPATPTTPGGSQPLEIVRSRLSIDSLEAGATSGLDFYLRASTLGLRAVSCELRYQEELEGKSCTCSSFRVFELEVIPPFSFNFSLFNQELEESKQVAADENFTIVPEISCVSSHSIIIKHSRLEGRMPLRVMKPTLSLESMVVRDGYKIEQDFPAVIHQQDLISQLESESVQLGKYHMSWARKSSPKVINDSVFELPRVKVIRSFLSLRCMLPPFGIIRTPAELIYELKNKTDLLQEYSLTMDASEAFMFSGPKQVRTKVFPRETSKVRFLLYPLITGTLTLPKLRILPLTAGGVASLDKCGTVEEIIARSLPFHLVVLPMDKQDPTKLSDLRFFELSEPTVIPNLPFPNPNCVKANV